MPEVAETTQVAISQIYPRPLKEILKPSSPCYDRSIQGLESVLNPNEIPEAVLFGQFRAASANGSSPCGGLWATNERLLFVGFQGFTQRTWVVSDYSYDLLTGVEIQGQSTFHGPKVVLRLGGDQLELNFHIGADVEKYADLLRQKSTFAFGRRQAQATDDGDLLSKLERLTVLRDKGALNEEEFSAAKKVLLGL